MITKTRPVGASSEGGVRTAERPSTRTGAPLRSVVVATDFSVGAAPAVERAASLPLAADARFTLVHVVPTSRWAFWGAEPDDDAGSALERVRARVAPSLPPGVRLSARIERGTPYAEIARAAREVDAELVVVGRNGASEVRDHFLGTTAEQVVRNGRTSVLVVRRAAVAPYRRPLCAVDLGGAAAEVITFARRLAPRAWGATRVLHAYTVPFEGMYLHGGSSDGLRAYRRKHREQVHEALVAELAAAGIAPETFRLALRHGTPRARVPAEVAHLGTDLLALGTHGHRGPAFALLGSVAGDILRDVRCDTLVVRTSGVTFERP